MFHKGIFNLVTACQLIPLAWSYGTIVEVYPSTCPALPVGPYVFPLPICACSSLIVPSRTMPPMQYLLTVNPGPMNTSPRVGEPPYITTNGSTTVDCSSGAPFSMSGGQLSSYGQIISATGLINSTSFAISANVGAISTIFSLLGGGTLAWNNTAFVGGHAIFCIMQDTVQAVFNGQIPAGCVEVSIGSISISSCAAFSASSNIGGPTVSSTGTITGTSSPSPTASVPGSISGNNATGNPLGCLNSSPNAPAVSASLPPRMVTTLEQCVDFCSSYAYFGVQSGELMCPEAGIALILYRLLRLRKCSRFICHACRNR
jgi:hypothetical protein